MKPIDLRACSVDERVRALDLQWLVCNGLGGYASGTLGGQLTWRYHGLLVAALPSPRGRTMMLDHLSESVAHDGGVTLLSGLYGRDPDERSPALTSFHLDHHLPVWRYDVDGLVIEKRVVMPHLQNTVHITYTLVDGSSAATLQLEPSLNIRPFEGTLEPHVPDYEWRAVGRRYEIRAAGEAPPLRLTLVARDYQFHSAGGAVREVHYAKDAARGYAARGGLWSPGGFSVRLEPGQPVTLVGSTEDWHAIEALEPALARRTERQRRERLLREADPRAREGLAADLVLAADAFVISPIGRVEDTARARAMGDEVRSVIAGYHWFTDWGRDTMISLEGLTLATGRAREARWILLTFAHALRDGLIPNLFPEGGNQGLYHTADATLWYFHAVHRYLERTGDRETLRLLLPGLRDIVAHHRRGTHFGIAVDPADGLLRQGEAGYQLTWMDAKVGDWVVTPRRGKAVEINALWYNALRLLEGWLREEEDTAAADGVGREAARAQAAFNRRFWNESQQCLFDVVDGETGDDAAIRPNQLFALSLPHPVLERARWLPVLQVVQEQLLTPFGLRSLSPQHPDYQRTYSGDLRARDAAYHQGTVWAWLIGPFIDAWLKVHPNERTAARRFLEGFAPHLSDGCMGSISEVFDAEPPFHERGCIAQAWSVAEVLRVLVLTADDPGTGG